MPIQRKYDFQPGTKILSSQIDEEFNQVVNQINLIETVDTDKDTDLRTKAQMSKMTADTGAPKISISDPSKDLLVELLNEGVGFHTFYAVNGTKNLPVSRSIRGFFHNTGGNFGLLHCQDSDGVTYTNYLNGEWRGWKRLVSVQDSQEVLWSGNRPPDETQTTIPSKRLSECRSGWVLVWSDFDPAPDNKSNDYDFAFTYIPKAFATLHNGGSCTFTIANYLNATTKDFVVKRLNIFDDKIIGHTNNNESGTSANDVTLRYVLEY